MTLRVPSSVQSDALHLVRRTTQEVQFDTGFLTAVVEGFSHAGYLLVPGTHSEERCVCSFITCSHSLFSLPRPSVSPPSPRAEKWGNGLKSARRNVTLLTLVDTAVFFRCAERD